ncbi:MAG: CPBP family intramembrane metalloprotease [bacterium]|nr:CPBP family intramembrane metalloprotease [bacterium]
MATIKDFIKKHPVITYFVMTFAISWGGVLIVIGPGGIPAASKEQFDALLPAAILALLAGPSVTGILLTGLVYGRAGYLEFLSRLFRWRVGIRWYAAALLIAPLVMTAVLFALSFLSPQFLPGIFVSNDKISHLMFGLSVGLVAGLFEELGWTGFAIPELIKRYSVFITGLIVGVLWGVWHLIVCYWISGTYSGELSLISYLLDPLLLLPVFRVLMVWVYDRTGSLLVGMLMHISLTASARIISPLVIAGVSLLAFDLVWFAAVCGIVAAVAVANGGQFSRQPIK